MPQSTIQRTATPESSQIDSFGYDPTSQRLAVKFKSTSGTVYEYRNVPADVAAAMAASDSKGSFVYRQIKGKYDFDKLPEVETATESSGGETD